MRVLEVIFVNCVVSPVVSTSEISVEDSSRTFDFGSCVCYVKMYQRTSIDDLGRVHTKYRIKRTFSRYPLNTSEDKDFSQVDFDIAQYRANNVVSVDEHDKAVKALDDKVFGNSDSVRAKNNVFRACQKVFEIAFCNDFKYFVTLTLDPSKFAVMYPDMDLKDLDAVYKVISKWFNNYSRSHGSKLIYVIVPETHESGVWHFHALMSGFADGDIEYSGHRDKRGNAIYNWVSFFEKFGLTTLTRIRDYEHCCWYITKYLRKSFSDAISNVSSDKLHRVCVADFCNKQLYRCSHGLRRASDVCVGIPVDDVDIDTLNHGWVSKDGLIATCYDDFDNIDDVDNFSEAIRDSLFLCT